MRTIRLWDLATGKEIRSVPLPSLAWSVFDVIFSPDGKLFAAHANENYGPILGGGGKHRIHIGEAATGKVLPPRKGSDCQFSGMTFSPDGTMLAACRRTAFDGKGPALVLWDTATGKEVRTFANVSAAVITPDGKRLVVNSERRRPLLEVPAKDDEDAGVIRVLELDTGREVRRLEGHRATVCVIAVSPDGRSLVSADEGPNRFGEGERIKTSVRLWDLNSGKLRRQWLGHEEQVTSLEFSPAGRVVLVADARDNLLLYDVASGDQRQRIPAGPAADRRHTFSPDGKLLLLHDQGGPFREWDIARGEERRRWGGSFLPGSMVYSPDGKVLVSRGPDGLVVWDVGAGKEWHGFPGPRSAVRVLAFSPDGRLVASVDQAGLFGIWEASTGKPLLPLSPDTPERAMQFRFSTDGALLSAVGKDGTVRVWELRGGLKERRFRIDIEEATRAWEGAEKADWGDPNGSPHEGMVYSPDGKLLAVLGEHNAIHLWHLTDARRVVLHGHEGAVGHMLFSPDGRLFASAGEDTTIRLWDAGTGKELANFRGAAKESAAFLFSPDAKVLAWSWGDALHLWDVAARQEVHRFPIAGDDEQTVAFHGFRDGHLAFHRDGKALAVAGYHAVHLWDLATEKELRTLGGEEYHDRYTSLFRSPDGAALAYVPSGHLEHALYEVATGHRTGDAFYWGDARAIAPDGKTLVVGRGPLKVVEMITGETMSELPFGHRGELTALAFSADGKLLATGGSDGTILVWDWRRGCCLAPTGPEKIGARELERAWHELGGKSAKTAYRAIATLTASGDEAVAWLEQRLHPVTEREREAIRQLLAALDDDRFKERDRASKELEQLGADAEPALRQALAGRLSPEATRRVEGLLAGPASTRWPLPMLQKVRAVQALEQIGTARAREVLEKLAHGIPEARLTREAQDALARLSPRR
jgi:WD40 repeat protein